MRQKIERNNCLSCNKICSHPHRKYCSHKCQQDFIDEAKLIEWLITGKLSWGNFNLYNSDWLRKKLRQIYQNKCCLCGWNKINLYTKIIPLEIEHIDGNFNNNSFQNLMLLCPNCHSLTSTFRALNKGKGRTKRNKMK